jgi:hypothetical protein
MRYLCNVSRIVSFLLGVSVVAILWGWCVRPVLAASTERASAALSAADHRTVETKRGRRGDDERYFIEFRARSDIVYGHLYVVYGRVNEHDEIVERHIAGLHPTGDAKNCSDCSLLNWTLGHVIFVPSDPGASEGDLKEKYVTARYRVWMDRAHYQELGAYIRKLQHDNPMWNALWNNCVEFGRSIAGHMGLKMPLFVWLEPKEFVTELREMNSVKKAQFPSENAANSLRTTTTDTMSTTPLPPQRPKLLPASDAHSAASKSKPASKPKKPVASLPQEQALASSATR